MCGGGAEFLTLVVITNEPGYFKACLCCLNTHRDVQAGANLSFNRQFYDEHWSKHRVVTCMDWSLQVSCEVMSYIAISGISLLFYLIRFCVFDINCFLMTGF